MIRPYIFIFFVVLTIPLFLGINALQANRSGELRREITRLHRVQTDMLERNRQASAEVTEQLSTVRLRYDAGRLGLRRVRPEDILLINITGGERHGL